jgi:ribosomal protein S18 acetylase RimI-like enzyme
LESLIFGYKVGLNFQDEDEICEFGPSLVSKMVGLFSECAYAPSEVLVGEFVSQVLSGNPDPNIQHGLIFATCQRELVAVLMFRCVLECADLDYLGVAKTMRGSGIGKKLMLEFERISEERGCERSVLEVSDRNVPALATYRALGYEEVGRRRRYYPSGEDALILEKFLENCEDIK